MGGQLSIAGDFQRLFVSRHRLLKIARLFVGKPPIHPLLRHGDRIVAAGLSKSISVTSLHTSEVSHVLLQSRSGATSTRPTRPEATSTLAAPSAPASHGNCRRAGTGGCSAP